MSTVADTAFKITNTKLWAQIVNLSSKGNVKPVKTNRRRILKTCLLEWTPNKNRSKRFRQ